jgi:2'-hydroxyisoflavone reductase
MRLLILGGTVFLGRHLTEAALAAGHTVTLFNRGQRNPELFPEVEKLRGNRDGDLEALRGRRWDAVIDPSGCAQPRPANCWRGGETFTSSQPVGLRRHHARHGWPRAATMPHGLACEEITGGATARSGVVGPPPSSMRARLSPPRPDRRATRATASPTGRRARGSGVGPDHPAAMQFIDVRDLAEWIIRLQAEPSALSATARPNC